MTKIYIEVNTKDSHNEVKIEVINNEKDTVIDMEREYELLENAYLKILYERDKKGLSIHYK